MSNVVFLDTETTGLDPERHEVWDIALIDDEGEHEWHVRPQNFHTADEGALRITKFYERVRAAGYREETVVEGYPKRTTTVKRPNFWTPESRTAIAAEVAGRTANKHLVGAVPWFDARFLTAFLAREGYVPAWHYHMIDTETLAVGYLRGRQRRAGRGRSQNLTLPWDSHEISSLLGVTSDEASKHTAIGDARWARDTYEAVMGKE